MKPSLIILTCALAFALPAQTVHVDSLRASSMTVRVVAPNSGNVLLTWTAADDVNVTGYKLYCGTNSGSYQLSADAGNATRYQFTNLAAGQTYYFAAVSYGAAGAVSDYSNEVNAKL